MDKVQAKMNWSIQLEPDEKEVRALRRQPSNYNIARAHVDEGYL